MLGIRGSRLAFVYQHLYLAQYRALHRALMRLKHPLEVRVMFPFIAHPREFLMLRADLEELFSTSGPPTEEVSKQNFDAMKIGVMLETPSACLLAPDLVHQADFMSVGSNDLTQMSWGLSRDDCGALISQYESSGYMPNPFRRLSSAVKLLLRPVLSGGAFGGPASLCGEHAADPASALEFFALGGTCLSVSVSSIPIAQIVAAQWTSAHQ